MLEKYTKILEKQNGETKESASDGEYIEKRESYNLKDILF